jgi:hypothetical protein
VSAATTHGMGFREGYHRKEPHTHTEPGRIDLERSKFHLLSLPSRLPKLAQTLLFEAAHGRGNSFEAVPVLWPLRIDGVQASL